MFTQPHKKDDDGEPKKGRGKRKGKGKGPPGPRIVCLNGGNELEGLPGNSIKTAKYNVITFLPIFVVEMFSRVAYLYFLAQV